MKRVILSILLFSFFFTNYTTAQAVNDKVKVEHNGSWYDATILKVDKAKKQYYITYDDWGESWDEWVGIERLKGMELNPPGLTKFSVGDKVEVEYGMIPEPATIIEVGENKYHIEFDDDVLGDKWVKESEITKL